MESYVNTICQFFLSISDSDGYWYSVMESPITRHSIAELLGISNGVWVSIMYRLGLVRFLKNKPPQLCRQKFEFFSLQTI